MVQRYESLSRHTIRLSPNTYNGFVFKIYSNEEKRMHIHIVKAENEAKFWLEPEIELAENFGFNSKELSFIEKILREYGDEFKIKFARHTGKSLDDK